METLIINVIIKYDKKFITSEMLTQFVKTIQGQIEDNKKELKNEVSMKMYEIILDKLMPTVEIEILK